MALDKIPQGNRPRGRPKLILRRSVLNETKTNDNAWLEIKTSALYT